ncbi:DUF4265 domain-containing protein [Flavobacterium sp. PL02]|uniref:DUF4265 domain-containing protein n=1 Tax=Flavobacterium sp. PL02 TaxID=3088354 RepID=UPI002B22998B|nr:DUF4265 domain-containing protein [Flavobacterium sp. PL02]MEA9413872.1 DUF4265 domain-containing protein [Flavobacterium sp. PL02]
MAEEQDKYVKILFRFFSEILNESAVETIWATVINAEKGLYKLDNIPFYAPVSCEDVVLAEFDENEQKLTYRQTIEHSGNSTIQVVVLDKTISTDDIRMIFDHLGCESEKFNEGYFVMEVLSTVKYEPIREKLNELQNDGIIDYAEPNLSNNHWY